MMGNEDCKNIHQETAHFNCIRFKKKKKDLQFPLRNTNPYSYTVRLLTSSF